MKTFNETVDIVLKEYNKHLSYTNLQVGQQYEVFTHKEDVMKFVKGTKVKKGKFQYIRSKPKNIYISTKYRVIIVPYTEFELTGNISWGNIKIVSPSPREVFLYSGKQMGFVETSDQPFNDFEVGFTFATEFKPYNETF